MMQFSTATSGDLVAITALLNRNHLPVTGVKEHLANFMLVFDDDRLIGCAGLEIYSGAALLRSVCIDADYRNEGLGQKLTDAMLELAAGCKLAQVALLTTNAEAYFARSGFVTVARHLLPEALHASAELQGACPERATAMVKYIDVSR
jgi:amino-acid N-acetyltransferase